MNHSHALIVGGTRGIGRALAQVWAARGYGVSVIGSRPPEKTPEKKDGNHFLVDVSDEARLKPALDEIIAEQGPLTSLVFLQRFRRGGDAWTGELATSLTATKNMIELLKDSFSADAEKSIVVVNSIASRLIAAEQPLSYHVAKAALLQLVRYFAVTLGPSGIRVNSVSLGTVIKEESQKFYAANQKLADLYKKITPLRRMGTANEVAAVIDFLSSTNASFVTGQDLVVDGGVSLQGHEALARGLVDLGDLRVTQPPAKERE